MSTLTPAQVAAYALGAGFQGRAAVKAVSVALAESGGRTDATNVNHDRYRSRDRGLWQINSHWHPEVTDAQAYNPAAAAAAAYRISHAGRDWSAWSTWTNGAAAAMRPRAALAVAQARQGGTVAPAGFHIPLPPGTLLNPGIPGVPGLGDLPGVPGTLANPGIPGLGGSSGVSLGQLVILGAHAGQWIADPHNWLRVVMVTAGAAGIITAAVLLAESGAAGSTAQQVARTTTNAAKGAAKKAAVTAALA